MLLTARKSFTLSVLAATLLLPVFAGPTRAEVGKRVAVIARSVSTRMHARTILSEKGWHITESENADAVLVVVRSELSYPLDYCYDDLKKLSEDADGQLNISGSNFVVYLYSAYNDQPTCQLSRVRYPAHD